MGPGTTAAQGIGFSERKASVYFEKHPCISVNMDWLRLSMSCQVNKVLIYIWFTRRLLLLKNQFKTSGLQNQNSWTVFPPFAVEDPGKK